MMYKWEVPAMTAVIYARYSSDNQREESIEGQIRECTAYAEKNDITIVKHYIDRAISAKTDNRPQFQQMIKDSDKKLFDIVLVWKLDRFARNRYDSARYKTQLKKNGVKLMSATEIISEGPEGIILESVLEGYAEYYSADLAEKVVRGQTENILKGRCNGGRGTFGYTLDSERKFHIDPLASPFVLESFKKYRDGLTMKEIRDWLNENGIKNPVGGAFTYNSVEHMLKNRRYIGELKFRDVVVPDAIPPIVPLELFDDVQEKIAKNKKAPARRKAEDDYLLTTKLYCGYCGALMFGESGTSRTGEVHRYYKCATAKKKKGCKKKTVRKQWLEDLVVNQTMQLVRDDAAMESIIAKVMELQDRENTNLPLYEKQLRDAESGIQNMLNAIQAGILTSSTKERLEQLEETKRELETRIAEEKLAKPKIKEEFIRFWLMRFRKLDMSLKDQRQALVDTFINSIYLYDDKVLITFNYKEGTQAITFEEAAQAASKGNGSDLDCFTAPRKTHTQCVWVFLYCRRRFLPAGRVHFQKPRSLKSYCKKVKLLYNRACTPVCAGTVFGIRKGKKETMSSSAKSLTEGPLAKQILLVSLPLALSNLLQVLFNMSDVAVVGRFAGSTALGSVGSTSIFVTLFTGFLIGLNNGINVLVARFYGARHADDVEKTVHSALLVSIAAGVLLLLIGLLGSPALLHLLNTKEDLYPGAVLYLRVYFLGMPALALYNYGNAIFSAIGETKKPLYYLCIAGVLNILLNLFFVIVCHLDVVGVALASAISQCVSAFLVLRALTRVQDCYALDFHKVALDPATTQRILALGLPAGFQNAVFAIANLFIQAGVNSFDSLMVKGNSAAANADNMIYDAMAAFYMACASFMSQNYGAGKPDRVKKSYFIALAYSFGVGLVLGGSLFIFGRQFLALFTTEGAVIDAGMKRVGVMGFAYCISAFMDCTIAASRGLGKTVVPTIIVVLGSCVFRVIWVYTIFAHFHTIPSLYLLYPCSWTLTAIAEIVYFIHAYKDSMKIFTQPQPAEV